MKTVSIVLTSDMIILAFLGLVEVYRFEIWRSVSEWHSKIQVSSLIGATLLARGFHSFRDTIVHNLESTATGFLAKLRVSPSHSK